MPNAEAESTTLAKLTLIAQRAKENPGCRFTSLAHLLDAGFLRYCYYQLGQDRASGVDGVSWKEYGERLEENLRELVSRLKGKKYRPRPAKRVYIPKDERSKRPLGLPALEDKIVQKGIALILEAIYEADFLDSSYGYRPGRTPHQALKVVDETIGRKPINHVIDADIKGFFDTVSHEWLMKFLGHRLVDPSLLGLIRRFLKAGYVEAGEFEETERGTPQGGNLSPMLSNIYLHYVLDLWFEKRIKPQARGECRLVRYADDFICMVQYQEDARRIEGELRERFTRFELQLHPEKTRVLSFGRYEPRNAQRQGRKANTFDFLGFTHYCAKSRKGHFKVGRRTSRKKFRKKCKELTAWLKKVRCLAPAKEWWKILRAKLQGHYQYYGVSGNYPMIRQFYLLALRQARKWLNRRSQRGQFSAKRFGEYLEHYPLPIPKLKHSFYTEPPVR